MIAGEWKTATVDAAGTTSAEVDLGLPYDEVLIDIPTLDLATVALSVTDVTGGTFVPLHQWRPETFGNALWLVAASTGGFVIPCKCLHGFRYVKVVCGAAQNGGARAFKLRGVRR